MDRRNTHNLLVIWNLDLRFVSFASFPSAYFPSNSFTLTVSLYSGSCSCPGAAAFHNHLLHSRITILQSCDDFSVHTLFIFSAGLRPTVVQSRTWFFIQIGKNGRKSSKKHKISIEMYAKWPFRWIVDGPSKYWLKRASTIGVVNVYRLGVTHARRTLSLWQNAKFEGWSKAPGKIVPSSALSFTWNSCDFRY